MVPARERFLGALNEERPLQIVGVTNAYCAKLAAREGFRALYLSGAGIANAAFGLPDLGVTALPEVVEEARRITSASDLPLLVDCDTGWGSPLTIARTVREMTRAGVAALHLEDQHDTKRCGHRPGKRLVAPRVMIRRLQAAVDARGSDGPLIMARTDAAAGEGLASAIDRACRYVEAGADLIFAEALTTADEYRQMTAAVPVPVLANLTEFGKTPLLTAEELRDVGVRMVLYPLTAFRVMSAAAINAFATIRREGTQQSLIADMQTRADLYSVLDYETLESQLDTDE